MDGDAQWFHVMLHLNDKGCVPGEANGGATATKGDCLAEFGPPTAQGRYSFLHRGCTEYNLYIRDLYKRVYQRDGNEETTIPWHFARGLLEEERGVSVNWARVAYRRISKYRKGKAFVECLLPAFQSLVEPFPFQFPKVHRGCATAMVGNMLDSSSGEMGAPLTEAGVTPATAPKEQKPRAASGGDPQVTNAACNTVTSSSNSRSTLSASAYRGLQILSPSIRNITVATKAAVASETLPFGDINLLKRKKMCEDRMQQLEEGVQLQNRLFKTTISIAKDAYRRFKQAREALAMARSGGESSVLIEMLSAVEEISEGDLKRIISWSAIAKNGMEAMKKEAEDVEDEVTALDIEIHLTDGVGEVLESVGSRLADLEAVLEFLG